MDKTSQPVPAGPRLRVPPALGGSVVELLLAAIAAEEFGGLGVHSQERVPAQLRATPGVLAEGDSTCGLFSVRAEWGFAFRTQQDS